MMKSCLRSFCILLISALIIAALYFGSEATKPGQYLALPKKTQTLTKIAFGSCARQYQRQPIWRAIVKTKPDLFLFIGDNVYGDSNSEGLWELNAAYLLLNNHPDFTKARSQMPIVAIWDDHDYGLNDGGKNYKYKGQSADLFRKFWGINDERNEPGRGLYWARIFGEKDKKVQIILIDTRMHRDDLKTIKSEDGKRTLYVPDDDPAKTMLGEAQWQWLEGELQKQADLRILVSTIQVLADNHAWERWGNLPKEQNKLLQMINARKGGELVILSGDRHHGSLMKLSKETNKPPLFELTSSSLNAPYPWRDEPTDLIVGKPVNSTNFGLLTIDWLNKNMTMELKDGDGKTKLTHTLPFHNGWPSVKE